jgi:hypothetical protein
MSTEMARIIARLRQWHTEGADVDPDNYAMRLGVGESIVSRLLEQLDKEGADDGPTE